MKKSFLVLAFLMLVFPFSDAIAQELSVKNKKAIAHYSQAVNLYRNMQFSQSMDHVEMALEREPQFVEAYLLKAELHRLKEESEEEISSYKKVLEINSEFFPYTLLNLGNAQYSAGLYEEALVNLNQFIETEKVRPSTKDKAKHIIKLCEQAQLLKDNPVEFEPINLGPNINNEFSQYWPSLSLKGDEMVYTVLLIDSTRRLPTGEFKYQEDFFASKLQDGVWEKGYPIQGAVNTSGNEGAQQLSADGKLLFFTGCNRADGQGKCDIYVSVKLAEGWTRPVNMGPSINTGYSEKQPSLSPDGKVLFFSSNRPGGFGGMDIWYSVLNDEGKWSRAENMGEKINTTADDISPFIHADNKSFYFSSAGHAGLGKQDIFLSRVDSTGQWSMPKNIGYPINTHRDEIGLFVEKSGRKAYYSSNVNSSSRNIYSFLLPEEMKPTAVSYVKGKVYDELTKKPLHAKMLLLDLISGDTAMEVLSEEGTGEFLMCLPVNQNFALNVTYTGYLFFSKNFNLSEKNSLLNPFEMDVPLQAIKVGSSIVLDNIFFEHNSYKLEKESKLEINKIQQFLSLNPSIKLEIGGHTDSSGDDEYNLTLSENRAKEVYEAIIKDGNFVEQLSFKGYGESLPVNDNATIEQRALNRRTELKVISVK